MPSDYQIVAVGVTLQQPHGIKASINHLWILSSDMDCIGIQNMHRNN